MLEINTDLRDMHIIGPGCNERLVGPANSPSLSFFDIRLAGLTRAVPEFRFVRTRARFNQLLVCLGGFGHVWVAGEWLRCTPGTAYVTPADAFHAYHAVAVEPWEFCFVIYSHAFRSGLLAQLRQPALIPADPQRLPAAIEGLYDEATGMHEPPAMHHWIALVDQYAQRILEPAAGSDTRLRQLWKEVETNLDHPWDLEQLAARINVTPEHLRRLCRRQVHASPMHYVTRLRLRHAASLLASRIYSVEVVARKVGYTNAFAFSTAFKREMGMPPSEYSQALQEQQAIPTAG
jgi:AraC-like DNA-binding protein